MSSESSFRGPAHRAAATSSAPLRRWCAAGVVLAVLGAPSWASTLTDAVVAKITQARYASYVTALQDFETRYYGTAGNAAALSYIAGTFGGFGLTADYDPFTYGGVTYKNVVATLPGMLTPEKVFIVGAHMDSTSDQPTTRAPGADDNASGMAAVLEMAKVLSGYRFESTIKFIGFNLEEQGLIGSKAYADEAKASGEKVLGMLNFDMIAYPGSATSQGVYLAGDKSLVDALASNAAEYTSLIPTKDYRNLYGSDHYHFHSSRFPGSFSAFAIESFPVINPNYHKTTDTVATLDFGYASDITRMGVATLANLAGITAAVPEPSAFVLLCFGGLVLFGAMRLQRSRADSA